MRFIPRTLHAALDYTFGLFLAFSPWLFGFAPGPATAIPLVLGLGALVYSVFTNYEGGLMRVIPFRVHLMLDAASAFVLLIAPFVLHLSDVSRIPFIAFGLFEIAAALLTDPDAQGPVPRLKA